MPSDQLRSADVTMSVMHFISFEMFHVVEVVLGSGSFAAIGYRTVVAMPYIVVVIYMAIKTFGTMKPRACADEDAAAGKPLRAVVAVGGTAVGSVVVIAIGTRWRYADVDADLSLGLRSTCCNAETSDCGQS
jgi:hypothetical protein